MADLLGKPAAVLMPTGAMASQVALRLHADARATRLIGFHPLAHIEVHEAKGYELVHHLSGRHLGSADRLITLADLQSVREPLAAVLWELPQRDLGGVLPEWADLVAQTSWVQASGAGTHLDGARLWEAQPYYNRSHAEIAGLFETAYVSLYKGLGGLAGGVLAGPEALINEARDWRTRLGGRLYQAWPLALAGEIGLDRHLPQMASYWAHAREIAAAVQDVPGMAVVPAVPQTALFHVQVDVDREALDAAHQELLEQGGIRLYLSSRVTADGERSQFEVTISEGALAVPVEDIRGALTALVQRAQGRRPGAQA